MARAGLVDLRDLVHRYAWDPRAIERAISALALRPEGVPRSRLSPPAEVVAIVPHMQPELLAGARAWLDDAQHVTIVRAHDEEIDDPEVAELVALEWREAIAQLDVGVGVVDWDRDVAPFADAIACAAARAAELHDPGDPPPRPIVEHAPGRPFALAPVPTFLDLEAVLARQLVTEPSRALLHTGDGVVDLADPPPRVDRLALEPLLAAVAPDGRLLTRGDRVSTTREWRLGEQVFRAPGLYPLGFDGHRPIAWTGHRMSTFLLRLGRNGPGLLSAHDHDFPCGPARKLYGYANNDSRRVDLAPDLSMLAARFEHDVLVTDAVPVRWRAAGPIDVADFPRDPARALLFTHADEQAITTDLLDEDARDAAPTVVIGPSAAARYAVDLSATVYRITTDVPGEGVVATVGGAAGGFAVFDHAHREVRRGSGRLLGGWFADATIADAGVLWREDLATGVRRRLGPLAGTPVCAVPVPWTRNVVLVSEGAGGLVAALV